MAPAREPAEVICHGDAAPYNYVVRNGEAVGLIDFDAAHPGPRVRDVAYAVHRFAPLHGPDNPESFGTPRVQGRRAAAFCRAYGPGVGAEVVDVVAERLRALIAFMRDRAAHGDEAFQRHLAEGHADAYEADIRHFAPTAPPCRPPSRSDRHAAAPEPPVVGATGEGHMAGTSPPK
ncbi:phosphotransferase [Streptomyces koyangensis]|uniref:phosphotransferase n=1 Tax=Streptomyces koyangensis TaxID=188770 RepID=UPI003C2D6CAB